MAMQIDSNGEFNPQYSMSDPWTVGYGKSGNVLSDSMSGAGGKKLFLVGRTAQALGQAPGTMMDWSSMSDSDKSKFAAISHQLERESDTEKRKKLQQTIKIIAGTALAAGAIYFAAGAAAGGGGAAAGGGGAATGTGATGAAGGSGAAAAGGSGLTGASAIPSSSLGLSGTSAGAWGGAAGASGAAGAAGGAGSAAVSGGAAAVGGGGAAVGGTSAGASSGFWGAAKGVLANKALMSGTVTALGAAYGQYSKKKEAKSQYEWQSNELERQRQYQREQYERRQNSPVRKMAPYLMQYYLPQIINKMKSRNNGGDASALDQMMAAILGTNSAQASGGGAQ